MAEKIPRRLQPCVKGNVVVLVPPLTFEADSRRIKHYIKMITTHAQCFFLFLKYNS